MGVLFHFFAFLTIFCKNAIIMIRDFVLGSNGKLLTKTANCAKLTYDASFLRFFTKKINIQRSLWYN